MLSDTNVLRGERRIKCGVSSSRLTSATIVVKEMKIKRILLQ
jgi:hypothetical protein